MTAYTEKQIARGRREKHRAEWWRRNNPEAWSYLERIAIERAREGLPISGRALVEAAREKAFTDREGRTSKVNNNYAPVFARWMLLEHPETAAYIKRRSTVFNLLIT